MPCDHKGKRILLFVSRFLLNLFNGQSLYPISGSQYQEERRRDQQILRRPNHHAGNPTFPSQTRRRELLLPFLTIIQPEKPHADAGPQEVPLPKRQPEKHHADAGRLPVENHVHQQQQRPRHPDQHAQDADDSEDANGGRWRRRGSAGSVVEGNEPELDADYLLAVEGGAEEAAAD